MTDDSPYQDAKQAKEHLNGLFKSVDDFFKHSTGKLIGPAATKARAGLKAWWNKPKVDRPMQTTAKPADAGKTWWPPFGWGQAEKPAEAAPEPAFDADNLETLEPMAPDEGLDTDGIDV